jgi:rhodanese-related sulfurtransferase
MANPYGVPEISVQEVAQRRAAGEDFIVLDVREPMELNWASLEEDVEHVPMSRLASEREAALPEGMMDKDKEIVVMCHHGNRSAQVAAWLRGQGWTNVWNLTGGIDAYAREVDPDVGMY